MKLPHRRQFLYLAGLGGAAALGGAATWLAAQAQQRTLQLQVLHLQADVVAVQIHQFIGEVERQMGWITQLLWSRDTLEQRRRDAVRLLHQVPAITDFAQLDS